MVIIHLLILSKKCAVTIAGISLSSSQLALQCSLTVLACRNYPEYMDGTVQATAGLQDSAVFQKAIKMALRCILSVNSHL